MKAKITPYIIAIAGGTASGKSSVAACLAQDLVGEVSVIGVDNYYWPQDQLAMEERVRTNYDHPDAFEWPLLEKQLEQFAQGEAVEVPIYDYTTHTRAAETLRVEPTPFVILEGVLALWSKRVREICNLAVFVHCPTEVRFERRLNRDVVERGRTRESVFEQWKDTVYPMHEQYCEPSRQYAHFEVSGEQKPELNAELILLEIKHRQS